MTSLRVLAAYAGVVLIWTTTPLAIKWSGEGPGFLFGVTARMSIGLFCAALVLALRGQALPLHRRAWWTYLAGAVQVYGALLAPYWSAPHMPSGWISVVFGLAPLITALMAAAWLGERSLTPWRLLSYGLGIFGLAVMYGTALEFSLGAELGVAGIVLAAFLQSASSVWIKRIDGRVPALALVMGSLLIAVPAYLATYAWLDGRWPVPLPPASFWSIVYLGVVATPLGFALYFYVLRHLPATRVALITLITPVSALLLGHLANGEPLSLRVGQGTALILGALLLHELSGRRPAALPVRSRGRSSRGSVP
jgi:drug/metabolite transporter (DMT)-like permease